MINNSMFVKSVNNSYVKLLYLSLQKCSVITNS